MSPIARGRLIALRAPAAVAPNGDLPTRLQLLKWGKNVTAKGTFLVGAITLASLAANQHKLGFDEIVLDFEHNTVPGHPSNKGEPAAIASRGKPVVIENEGLFLEALSWTEAGRANREHYPDLSPTIAVDENGEVIFVHSAALCRNGATYDLHAFSAGIDFKTLNVTTFEPTVNKTAVDLDRLRKILGVSPEATIEDMNRALCQLDGLPDTDPTALNADVAAILRTLTVKVNGFESRMGDAERAAIVGEALNAGKVIPRDLLEGDQKLSNIQLRTLVANLPEIVPLSMRTPERVKDFAALKPTNPERSSIQKQLGIDKQTFEKYDQAPA
jgi:hypothetical protein